MNNIGLVYDTISQPQEALKYFNQALPILRQVGDRIREATTLSNIDAVNNRSQPPSRTNIPKTPK
ncbi:MULTISPECIES: tetratricopeptide repeat protein [unclassified Microcoleus]|uniref:tetratricopeptide repeat protein n=1 Tax=unclassified Microcoleus TaxID=2642155 RepID=UPI002FD792CE